MANGRIKGITIELNGDATKLNKALESSEKSARESSKALREIGKNLKFNPGNAKLVEQQRNLTQAIEATKEKLKILQDADGQMKQQLAGDHPCSCRKDSKSSATVCSSLGLPPAYTEKTKAMATYLSKA